MKCQILVRDFRKDGTYSDSSASRISLRDDKYLRTAGRTYAGATPRDSGGSRLCRRSNNGAEDRSNWRSDSGSPRRRRQSLKVCGNVSGRTPSSPSRGNFRPDGRNWYYGRRTPSADSRYNSSASKSCGRAVTPPRRSRAKSVGNNDCRGALTPPRSRRCKSIGPRHVHQSPQSERNSSGRYNLHVVLPSSKSNSYRRHSGSSSTSTERYRESNRHSSASSQKNRRSTQCYSPSRSEWGAKKIRNTQRLSELQKNGTHTGHLTDHQEKKQVLIFHKRRLLFRDRRGRIIKEPKAVEDLAKDSIFRAKSEAISGGGIQQQSNEDEVNSHFGERFHIVTEDKISRDHPGHEDRLRSSPRSLKRELSWLGPPVRPGRLKRSRSVGRQALKLHASPPSFRRSYSRGITKGARSPQKGMQAHCMKEKLPVPNIGNTRSITEDVRHSEGIAGCSGTQSEHETVVQVCLKDVSADLPRIGSCNESNLRRIDALRRCENPRDCYSREDRLRSPRRSREELHCLGTSVSPMRLTRSRSVGRNALKSDSSPPSLRRSYASGIRKESRSPQKGVQAHSPTKRQPDRNISDIRMISEDVVLLEGVVGSSVTESGHQPEGRVGLEDVPAASLELRSAERNMNICTVQHSRLSRKDDISKKCASADDQLVPTRSSRQSRRELDCLGPSVSPMRLARSRSVGRNALKPDSSPPSVRRSHPSGIRKESRSPQKGTQAHSPKKRQPDRNISDTRSISEDVVLPEGVAGSSTTESGHHPEGRVGLEDVSAGAPELGAAERDMYVSSAAHSLLSRKEDISKRCASADDQLASTGSSRQSRRELDCLGTSVSPMRLTRSRSVGRNALKSDSSPPSIRRSHARGIRKESRSPQKGTQAHSPKKRQPDRNISDTRSIIEDVVLPEGVAGSSATESSHHPEGRFGLEDVSAGSPELGSAESDMIGAAERDMNVCTGAHSQLSRKDDISRNCPSADDQLGSTRSSRHSRRELDMRLTRSRSVGKNALKPDSSRTPTHVHSWRRFLILTDDDISRDCPSPEDGLAPPTCSRKSCPELQCSGASVNPVRLTLSRSVGRNAHKPDSSPPSLLRSPSQGITKAARSPRKGIPPLNHKGRQPDRNVGDTRSITEDIRHSEGVAGKSATQCEHQAIGELGFNDVSAVDSSELRIGGRDMNVHPWELFHELTKNDISRGCPSPEDLVGSPTRSRVRWRELDWLGPPVSPVRLTRSRQQLRQGVRTRRLELRDAKKKILKKVEALFETDDIKAGHVDDSASAFERRRSWPCLQIDNSTKASTKQLNNSCKNQSSRSFKKERRHRSESELVKPSTCPTERTWNPAFTEIVSLIRNYFRDVGGSVKIQFGRRRSGNSEILTVLASKRTRSEVEGNACKRLCCSSESVPVCSKRDSPACSVDEDDLRLVWKEDSNSSVGEKDSLDIPHFSDEARVCLRGNDAQTNARQTSTSPLYGDISNQVVDSVHELGKRGAAEDLWESHNDTTLTSDCSTIVKVELDPEGDVIYNSPGATECDGRCAQTYISLNERRGSGESGIGSSHSGGSFDSVSCSGAPVPALKYSATGTPSWTGSRRVVAEACVLRMDWDALPTDDSGDNASGSEDFVASMKATKRKRKNKLGWSRGKQTSADVFGPYDPSQRERKLQVRLDQNVWHRYLPNNQRMVLAAFLLGNRDLARNYTLGGKNNEDSWDRLWLQWTEQLNASEPGFKMSPDQWKLSWVNWRADIRKMLAKGPATWEHRLGQLEWVLIEPAEKGEELFQKLQATPTECLGPGCPRMFCIGASGLVIEKNSKGESVWKTT